MKTASDANRWQVDSSAWSTSVDYLRGRTPPSSFGSYAYDHRIKWPEYHMWIIKDSHLVQYRLEDDSDIHLVLKSYDGKTMIAEIPKPSCLPSSSRYPKSIANARSAFTSHDYTTTSWHYVNQRITVRGIGFFDEEHNATGQAPNGLELHPVTGIWWP